MIPWTVSGSSTRSPRSRSARVLLGVERVAADLHQQRLLLLGFEHRPVQQRCDELRACDVGQRRQRQRDGIRLAASPPRPPLEQLRTRSREDEERDIGQAVDELVEEVEERVVGPVEILEHERQRPQLGERFQKAPPGGERLAGPRARIHAADPDERAEMAFEPLRLLLVIPHELCKGAPELGFRLLGRVTL